MPTACVAHQGMMWGGLIPFQICGLRDWNWEYYVPGPCLGRVCVYCALELMGISLILHPDSWVVAPKGLQTETHIRTHTQTHTHTSHHRETKPSEHTHTHQRSYSLYRECLLRPRVPERVKTVTAFGSRFRSWRHHLAHAHERALTESQRPVHSALLLERRSTHLVRGAPRARPLATTAVSGRV